MKFSKGCHGGYRVRTGRVRLLSSTDILCGLWQGTEPLSISVSLEGKKDLCSVRHVSYESLVLLFPTVLICVPLTLKEVSGNTWYYTVANTRPKPFTGGNYSCD